MAARIAPLPSTSNPPDIQELLDFGTEATGGASNVFLTLAKNPQLFRRWLPMYAESSTRRQGLRRGSGSCSSCARRGDAGATTNGVHTSAWDMRPG